jgi:hypothetical protein
VQFKEQGGKVRVLVYSGYDEVKQVPRIKAVGSFDKYTYKPSPGLMDKLNAQQRDELEAEWQRRRQRAVGLNRQHYLNTLIPNLRGACESLREQACLTPEEAQQIWDALEDLSKAMRQAGYVKPARARQGLADPQQPTLLE